jgi:hypothetical protein
VFGQRESGLLLEGDAMNRLSSFFIALIFACSPVKGTPLIDAEVLSVESMKIAPDTVSERVGLDPPAHLTVTATLSDGTTRDVTNYVTWSSSDDTIATAAAGEVTAVHQGMATITAKLDGAMAEAQVSIRDAILAVTTQQSSGSAGPIPPGLLFFDASGNGNVAPLRAIQGSNTAQLNSMFGLDVDGSDNELFVVDVSTGLWVYPLDGSGSAVMPLRHIPPTTTTTPTMTVLTTMFSVHVVGDELYVGGEFIGSGNVGFGGVAVYPRLANGSAAAPTRLIGGSNFVAIEPTGLDVQNNVLYVGSLDHGGVRTFPADGSGDLAPTQTISGSASQIIEAFGVRVIGNEIFVSDVARGVLVFPIDANGSDVTPTRWIHGPDTHVATETSFTQVGNTLVCAQDQGQSVTTFPLEATEDSPPVSVLTGSATGLAFPIGLAAF